jgi:hypothetical protein
MDKKSEVKKTVDVFERAEVREWFSMVLNSKKHGAPKEVVVVAPYNMGSRIAVVPYREDKQ